MKTILLMLLATIPPVSFVQTGGGDIFVGHSQAIKIEGFRRNIGLRIVVKGAGRSDLDCWISDGLNHSIGGQDFTTSDSCTFFAKTNHPKMWLIVVNNGKARDGYIYRITEVK